MNVTLDLETAPYHETTLQRAGWMPPRSYRGDRDNWQQWHDDTAQLDPGRSWICAIGLYVIETGDVKMLWARTPGGDRDILMHLFAILTGQEEIAPGVRLVPEETNLIGHNLIDFDLKYLAARTLIHGFRAEVPVRTVIDTKVLWKARYLTGGASSSLDDISRTLGLPTKPGSGKDFWRYTPEEQQEYLGHDLEATARIAAAMGAVVVEATTTEVGGQRSEVGEVRTEEVGSQRSEVGAVEEVGVPPEDLTPMEDHHDAPAEIVKLKPKHGGPLTSDL